MYRRNYPDFWEINLDTPQDQNDPLRWGEIVHIPQGRMLWDPARITLFLTPDQLEKGSGIDGRYIKNRVRKLPALNASAMDVLVEQQHLIPESWRSFFLHFWGTIFHERKGGAHVRCLYWDRTRWRATDTLIDGFGWSHRSAAVLCPGLMTMAQYRRQQIRMRKRMRTPVLEIPRTRCA